MGMFSTRCAESGLALHGDVRLVPILETASGGYEPLAGMVIGDYDGYGAVDTEHVSEALTLVAELRALCATRRRPDPDGRDLWHALAQDVQPVRVHGRVLSYVLLDERVASVMEASTDGADVAPVDALGRPRSARDRRLASALAGWRTRLAPAWTHFGGQLSGESEDHLPFVRAARDKYGGNAAMLRAIEENDRDWRD